MHEVSSYINKSIVLKMDELMLANGTDTIAPQSFEELFVEPTITFHNDEDKIVEISDLLTNDDSYIIQGQKESGKTVLLNYFVKYYINIIHTIFTIIICSYLTHTKSVAVCYNIKNYCIIIIF